MEYISSAGMAWLARHGLNIDRMIDRWKQGLTVTPSPHPMDHEHDPESYPNPDGDIVFRNELWRTRQSFGRLTYLELGTWHARLTIDRLQLPETLLVSGKKPVPLSNFAEIPPECIASEAMGEIIRITNRQDNSVELLMRIKWYPISTAHMLERF